MRRALSAMTSATNPNSDVGKSCPIPSTMSSSAPLILAAVSFPASGETSGSSDPCKTSVGALMLANRDLKSPVAAMAAMCRQKPLGLYALLTSAEA